MEGDDTCATEALTLAFDNGTTVRTLTLGASQETSGAHVFRFDPSKPMATPEIASGEVIPDGIYTVTLSYMNVKNMSATAQSTNVRIDKKLPPILRPIVTLDSPSTGRVLQDTLVTFRGKITSVSDVARVEVSMNGGTPYLLIPFSSTKIYDWTLTVLPENGQNTVTVKAFSANGDSSLLLTRTFKFAHLRPEFAGSYNGLLEATADSASPIDHDGLITITVTSTGTFTGKVALSGTTFAMTGLFLNDGNARFKLGGALTSTIELIKNSKPAKVSLGHLKLALDTAAGADRIAGALTLGDKTVALLARADRALYTAKKNPAAPFMNVPPTLFDPLHDKGKYTALFVAGTAPNNGLAAEGFPQGRGWALVTIAPTGKVTIVGRLADSETTFSYANVLSKANELPVFVPLYGKKGFLAGPITFDPSQAQTDARGSGMKWFKPANPTDKLYRAGWPNGIVIDFVASKFAQAAKPNAKNPSPHYVAGTHNILGFIAVPNPSPIKLAINYGGTAGFSNGATVDVNSKIIIGAATAGDTVATRLTAAFTVSNGKLAGNFLHPGNNKTTTFSGVVLQKTHTAGGFFLYSPPKPSGLPTPAGISGSISITPES
jgi:hypothetical protein